MARQRFDIGTLNWVKGELDGVLEHARLALKTYVEGPEDEAQLRFCLEYLHQVRGALDLVGLQGAAGFARDMERLAAALINNPALRDDKAYETLISAVLQLPDYLESLQEGVDDNPFILLPLRNNLRRACGASPIAPEEAFAPDLSVMPPATPAPGGDAAALAVEWRRYVQGALLSLLRGRDEERSLKALLVVMEKLLAAARRPELRQCLWVAGGYLTALREGRPALDADAKQLLGRLERCLQQLAADGEDGPTRTTLQTLSRHLLYQLAAGRADTPRARELRRAFALDELIPTEQLLQQARRRLGGLNASLKQAVATDIMEEMGRVKDALDLYMRSADRTSAARLAGMAAGMERIGDTLVLLQQETLAGVLGEQAQLLRTRLEGPEGLDEKTLMGVAGAILAVESALRDWGALSTPQREDGGDGAPGGERDAGELRRVVRRVMEEARDQLSRVREQIEAYLGSGFDRSRLDPVPRWLHEIVGGMQMLSFDRVGHVLRACRLFVVNDLVRARVSPTAEMLDNMADAMMSVEYYLEAFVGNRVYSDDMLDVAEQAVAHLGYFVDALPEDEGPARAPLRADEQEDEERDAWAVASAPVASSGFSEQARDALQRMESTITAWQSRPTERVLPERLLDELRLLVDGGRQAEEPAMVRLSSALATLMERVLDGSVSAGLAIYDLLDQATEALQQQLLHYNGGPAPTADANMLEDAALAIARSDGGAKPTEPESSGVDPVLLEVYGQETRAHLAVVNEFVVACRDDGRCRVEEPLLRALHTLQGSSRMAGFVAVAEVAEELEAYARALIKVQHPMEARGVVLVERASQSVDGMLAHFADPQQPMPDYRPVLEELTALYEGLLPQQGQPTPAAGPSPAQPPPEPQAEAAQEPQPMPMEEPGVPPPGEEPEPQPVQISESLPAPAESAGAVAPPVADVSPQGAQPGPLDDLDPELLSIFLEEADELLGDAQRALQHWFDNPRSVDWLEALQRQLHTLKGSARTAGLDAVGELSHAMEAVLEPVVSGYLQAGESLQLLLQRAFDRLHAMVAEVRDGALPEAGEDLVAWLRAQAAAGQENRAVAASIAPNAELEDSGESETDSVLASEPLAESASAGLVRVRSGLLDTLVNTSGESGVYHSRIVQQVEMLHTHLQELEQTSDRLGDQLRRYEREVESQRYPRPVARRASGSTFDPLELEHISRVEQLSRAISESLGDVTAIEGMLRTLARDSDNLLTRQGRLHNQLQQGLLETRTVPLSAQLPRLQRSLRKACQDTGRQAHLELSGGEVELDRQVVERIMPALEHLLRNSVAHGVEDPQRRQELDKPAAGLVRLTLRRDGSDAVLSVSDDGAGIDREAVRARAVEKGLLAPNAELDSRRLTALLLESGFSTAPEVSAVAGRGVGLDVVKNEVRGLGGTIEITSAPGSGTTVTLRMPLHLSVGRVMLVQVGSEQYALPLAGIAGVVQVAADEVLALRRDADPSYRWMNNDYPLLELSTLLGAPPASSVSDGRIPLVLVNDGERLAALGVDALLGKREVVVKPLGAQLSALGAFNGATILGDGQVVLVLELGFVVQLGLAGQVLNNDQENAVKETETPLVLVVDDSITVRKVVTRLLEGQGMRTMVARDGQEAVALLGKVVPDLLILDIEMPHMDGFELAAHVRNEPRLAAVPMLMISSRTGEKHRRRADELGVQHYLGKPFQERELLDVIDEFIDGDNRPAWAGGGVA